MISQKILTSGIGIIKIKLYPYDTFLEYDTELGSDWKCSENCKCEQMGFTFK